MQPVVLAWIELLRDKDGAEFKDTLIRTWQEVGGKVHAATMLRNATAFQLTELAGLLSVTATPPHPVDSKPWRDIMVKALLNAAHDAYVAALMEKTILPCDYCTKAGDRRSICAALSELKHNSNTNPHVQVLASGGGHYVTCAQVCIPGGRSFAVYELAALAVHG